jgi:hypothetical protein
MRLSVGMCLGSATMILRKGCVASPAYIIIDRLSCSDTLSTYSGHRLAALMLEDSMRELSVRRTTSTSPGLNSGGAGIHRYGRKPCTLHRTLWPSPVTPNTRSTGTCPTVLPGIPGSGAPCV